MSTGDGNEGPSSRERKRNTPNPARRIARAGVRDGLPTLSSSAREMLINSIVIHARRSKRSVEEIVPAVVVGITTYATNNPQAKLDDIAMDAMGWLATQDAGEGN